MYFRVFIKFRVCTCMYVYTRYTIHDIDEFRVYTVTSLVHTPKALNFDSTNFCSFLIYSRENGNLDQTFKQQIIQFKRTGT